MQLVDQHTFADGRWVGVSGQCPKALRFCTHCHFYEPSGVILGSALCSNPVTKTAAYSQHPIALISMNAFACKEYTSRGFTYRVDLSLDAV